MGAGKRFSGGLRPGADPGPIIIAAVAAARSFAEEADLGERSAARLAVVVEELVSNALRHGAPDRWIKVSLKLESSPLGVAIGFEDDAGPFDPTSRPAFVGPDAETGGGVGLELVRAWAETFDYERVGDRNRIDIALRTAD